MNNPLKRFHWPRISVLVGTLAFWSGCGVLLLGCAGIERPMVLSASAVVESQSLKWSIAHEDIRSELEWKRVKSRGLAVQVTVPIKRRWSVALRGQYTDIFDGAVRDSDYSQGQEYSRSENDANRGNAWSTSIALGRAVEIRGATMTPQVGFAYQRQSLRLRNGFQVIPYAEHFGGLDSRYVASWHGPWAGLELSVPIGERVRLTVSSAVHWVRLSADAEWNLRPLTFKHHARGRGLTLRTELQWRLDHGWTVYIAGGQEQFETRQGTDRVYLSDGTRVETRLNPVTRKAVSVHVGARKEF